MSQSWEVEAVDEAGQFVYIRATCPLSCVLKALAELIDLDSAKHVTITIKGF